MNQPLVHVLVINWNGLEHLRECFDSLSVATYSNAKFILVDNASQDGSVDFVQTRYGHDSRVEILQCPENRGWSGGNNFGIERAMAAGADYVFLLNNDTVTMPDAIERLVATAEAHPVWGALAPKMLLYDAPYLLNSVGLVCSLAGGCWDLGLGRLDAPRWNVARQVIGVCGGACFLRVQALEKAGLLPVDFGIYLDDLDLCLRIWNAGFEIWSCPEAVVRHKFSATMGQGRKLRHKYYLNTRNRFWLILRNFPFSHWWEIKKAVVVGELRAIGRALLDRAWWKVGAHLQSWWAAIVYWPKTIQERRRRGRVGQSVCRFWGLIERSRLFFAGTPFPVDGWYEEREINGMRVRPMSVRAHVNVKGGSLRIIHLNCYPALGSTEVTVRSKGTVLASLRTLSHDEVVVDVPAGVVEFRAARVFAAEQTGETIDLGAWVNVEEC